MKTSLVSRTRWLPSQLGLLAILLVGYCFLAMLVVEQGRTIYFQQALIRTLFKDSAQLSNLRMRKVQADAGRQKSK